MLRRFIVQKKTPTRKKPTKSKHWLPIRSIAIYATDTNDILIVSSNMTAHLSQKIMRAWYRSGESRTRSPTGHTLHGKLHGWYLFLAWHIERYPVYIACMYVIPLCLSLVCSLSVFHCSLSWLLGVYAKLDQHCNFQHWGFCLCVFNEYKNVHWKRNHSPLKRKRTPKTEERIHSQRQKRTKCDVKKLAIWLWKGKVWCSVHHYCCCCCWFCSRATQLRCMPSHRMELCIYVLCWRAE